MAQLTVYLDDRTRTRIEVAARKARTSVSQWVKEQLTAALENRWPADYFELLGSLADSDLKRPPELDAGDDIPREPVSS